MSVSIDIGYMLLPDEITDDTVDTFKAIAPQALLKYISFDKEIVSLIHSLAGRYILNCLLMKQGINADDIELCLTDYKRPVIKDSKWKFSISHSGRAVVCALSAECSPGIDIEAVKQINPVDFEGQFSYKEYAEMTNDETFKTFYRYWTAKEAVVKAVGKGLYINLKDIIYTYPGQYKLENDMWYVRELTIANGYICTLATNLSNSKNYLHQFNTV